MATVTEPAEQALSIAEAAEASGLSAHRLRYYERTGLLEPVVPHSRLDTSQGYTLFTTIAHGE